jgi:tRNA G10  N-methylase Trm11
VPDLVLAATRWRSNAELIADCARLGYLREGDRTLDPTFGRGTWWKAWRPAELVAHDLAIDGVDFRDLPYADATFDAVAFDPPYVCVGGRTTSTMPEFQRRFGLAEAPRTPRLLQDLIDLGLAEMRRVVRPRGVVLVKCADYITGGRLWLGTHHTLSRSLELGFDVVDRLEHVGNARPQPKRSSQQHARRNLSTLFVLRAPR